MSFKYKGKTIPTGGGTVNWDQINGRPDLSTVSSMVVYPIVLLGDGWTQDNQQLIPVEGILADENAQLIIPLPRSSSEAAYNEAGVECVAQAKGILTFHTKTVPTADLSVSVYVFGAAEVKDEFVGTFEWWSPQMTSNTTPSPFAASASSSYSSSTAAFKAFDGNRNMYWSNQAGEDNPWISFDFGVQTPIKGISLYPRMPDYPESFPRSFDFQVSTDGESWSTVYQGETDSTPSNYVEFVFDNAFNYRYYRISNMIPFKYNPCLGEVLFYKLNTSQQGGTQ